MQPNADDSRGNTIAEFARASRRLVGRIVSERQQWNTEATADAIRHFAWGISDDNPLWVDRDYAKKGPHGRLAAPPTFLFSVMYPFLHGSQEGFALSFLISDITCRWYLPILESDELTATSSCKDVIEARDRDGRDVVYIVTETTFRNQTGEAVAVFEGTIAAVERRHAEMLLDREIHEYTKEDIEAIGAAQRNEQRTGQASTARLVEPGEQLPPITRGPLTVGDLVSWQAAIGPSYRAGSLAYRDLLAKPHTATLLPRVGWPVRYSQQHEDFMLTKQRGMPAPFDNSTMRAAWLSVLVTNWMGDHAFLRRLQVSTVRPVIYGDTNRYTATVVRKSHAGDEILVTLRLNGTNQLGEITTTGDAEVAIPNRSAAIGRGADSRRASLDWGSRDTATDPVTVVDLFATQVRARPRATAIKMGEQTASYAELNTRADRLAQRLSSRVLPGTRVGLYLGRSIDMAVAILACAKARLSYVPLDPSYPAKRLDLMLQVSKTESVLTNGRRFDTDAQLEFLPLPELDSESGPIVGGSVDGPALLDTAYVLFTSGFTGQGKAVTVDHGALGLYLRSIIESLGAATGDVFLHSASFSFSAAVRQFWLPLCAGATLVIADQETCRKPVALFELMRREGITVWDTVPSMLEFATDDLLGLEAGQRASLLDNRLNRVFTTGEPLPWKTVHAWRKLHDEPAAIVNLYSQTETAGTVCYYPVPDADECRTGFVPIGKPISNTGVCLLNEALMPVPAGEIGEICVAGRRLASGYVREATADRTRFIDLALDDGRTVRTFRTGDLGRRRDDGVLEAHGRADDQIKIRGLRVRLGEVEAALQSIPSVDHCVVVSTVDTESAAGPRLNAYVVLARERPLDAPELRTQLATRLPEHMLPQTITFLEQLPLSPNGKLDRSALPQPDSNALTARSTYVAPRNDTERLLGAIWCKFLRLDQVGVHDDFFELGGHSLLATRVLAHAGKATGVDVSLIDFFDKPTIADLAIRLQGTVAPVAGDAAKKDATGVIPRRPRGHQS